jgi:hypothetical protein
MPYSSTEACSPESVVVDGGKLLSSRQFVTYDEDPS